MGSLTPAVWTVPATKYHARELGRTMRPEDAREVWASGHMMPEQAVRASINRTPGARAAYCVGGLLAVYGVTLLPTGWAVPWVLTTTTVERYPLEFWQASKAALREFRDQYPQMVQMVHAHYDASLRWLCRLGFTIEMPEPFGVAGEMFCRVSLLTPKIVRCSDV